MKDEVLQALFELEALDPNTVCSTCTVEHHTRLGLERSIRAKILEDLKDSHGVDLGAFPIPPIGPVPLPSASDPNHRLYRCNSCGVSVDCLTCCLKRHEQSPLHILMEWTGTHWVRTSLRELGQVVQLGHGGFSCPFPAKDVTKMTVLHTNGVHRINVRWCQCQQRKEKWRQCTSNAWYPSSWSYPETVSTFVCLKRFRLLNVLANTNIRDFVTTLERMTDPLGTSWVPARYSNFGIMFRQWAFMSRMRRSGLAFLAGGISTAPLGSAAVRCLACPRAGFNLPEGWRDVEDNLRYKYNLFLGLDANFRLENKMRPFAKHKDYTVLGDGLGVFGPLEGADGYKQHLRKYVSEDDVSQCASFAALMQRDSRFSRGLRVTGVGGCSCTRHETVRPMGLADLLKGERYSTMDFVWWGALHNEAVLRVMGSYDIGCQWKIHLFDRLEGMPDFMRTRQEDRPDIEISLPVWHGRGHRNGCEPAETLRNKPGAGMTDGEGVERVWSVTNQRAYATREMQPDTRHASLEDHFDRHNFQMNLRLSNILPRKLRTARLELARQTSNFKDVSRDIPTALKAAWMTDMRTWDDESHLPRLERSVSNPYESPWSDEDLSEKDIRQELDTLEKDELEELSAGQNGVPKRITTTRAFLKQMLELQQTQLRIHSLLAAKGRSSWGCDKKVTEARKSVAARLPHIRRLQQQFMPLALSLMEEADTADAAQCLRRGTQRVPPKEENIKLWLPSEIPSQLRRSFKETLFIAEAGLQRIACSDNLDAVRHYLFTKSHLLKHREDVSGQKAGTRSRTLLDDVKDRLRAAVLRYRTAQASLVSLTDTKRARPYRKLEKDDITTKFVLDHDGAAANRLANVVRGSTRKRVRGFTGNYRDEDEEDELDDGPREASGHSRRQMSWIWTAKGAPDAASESFLHDAVRVEWCKAYARNQRWREEEVLVLEEMRRSIHSLESERAEWMARSADSKAFSGRAAYAQRQMAARDSLIDVFKREFDDTPGKVVKKRARNAV
ncbi:hypothetical protein CYLTODRAFT_405693 [Cylindrobasidium torrendii FP15055 ss-10]|uniref:CxC2-like cysteine cluster KDZ transposase-associated domain-containing protein n=1 Tax=Cylindrobasidium torrendii FP15055 ss-10 TaxID=1314674 RepID=A0A0D7AV97_9AGAR|nr:hypothetical protein CYLTODRAFT_405693 [Cylindrobasidium torrendii FP15055 ss-10]